MPRKKNQKPSLLTSLKELWKGSRVLNYLQNLWPLLAFLVFAGLLYFSKDFLFAARVNGSPIYKSTFNNAVVKQSGKQILDGLVAEKLILQEGEKKKIKITDKEVDVQMSAIEKNLVSRGQKLDQALAQQGLTRQQLREQIKVQKTLEKLLGSEVRVTEGEIDDFIKANAQFLSSSTDQVNVRKNVEQQLRQNKLQQKAQALIDKLKKEAKIEYFVNL